MAALTRTSYIRVRLSSPLGMRFPAEKQYLEIGTPIFVGYVRFRYRDLLRILH